ncbi:MAG: radical SAM protein [Thermodesulfobacteriota bacterium]|nr:radical SAM protein [Thermodesulfobacteriota bacterium]
MNWLFPQTTLQIEPTRRCNLNCKICMRHDLNETTASLSLEDFAKVLDSSNFRHVALHGWGEPLLNPELFQMVKHAESKGVSTELTTNGTLLQRNIEKVFASGLSIIAFGLHKKENLSVVMPQIQELITRRNRDNLSKPKAYVDIVIYRENQDEITGLIKASAELNVDGVVLHRVFNPTTSFLDFASKCSKSIFGETYPVNVKSNNLSSSVNIYKVDREVEYISVQEEKELFLKVRRLARELNVELYLPPRPSIPCRAVKHSIFVTSEGNVSPCPYLPEFYMGDALNEGLKEVIYSQRYRTFVRNMKKHPICNKCPLGSTNGGFYA